MIPAVLSNCSYVTALYCDCFGYAANGSTYDQNVGPKKNHMRLVQHLKPFSLISHLIKASQWMAKKQNKNRFVGTLMHYKHPLTKSDALCFGNNSSRPLSLVSYYHFQGLSRLLSQ